MGAHNRQYAELTEVYDELERAGVHRRLGCPVIDISELSIEETAHRVLRTVEGGRRRPQPHVKASCPCPTAIPLVGTILVRPASSSTWC